MTTNFLKEPAEQFKPAPKKPLREDEILVAMLTYSVVTGRPMEMSDFEALLTVDSSQLPKPYSEFLRLWQESINVADQLADQILEIVFSNALQSKIWADRGKKHPVEIWVDKGGELPREPELAKTVK